MVSIDTMKFNSLLLSYGTPSMTKEKVTGKHKPLVSINNLYPVHFLYDQRKTYHFLLNLQQIMLQSLKKEMNYFAKSVWNAIWAVLKRRLTKTVRFGSQYVEVVA